MDEWTNEHSFCFSTSKYNAENKEMPTKTFVAFDVQLLCKSGKTKVCSKLMVDNSR